MALIKAPQAGRADLLRLLAGLGKEALDRAAPLLGYRRAHAEVREDAPPPTAPRPPSRVEVLAEAPRAEAPRVAYWAVEERRALPGEVAAIAPPDWYPETDPNDPVWQAMADDRPVGDWRVPPWRPLLPWSRLGPWLRRRLGDTRPGREPDVARLLDLMTAGRPLRRIPMTPRRGWAPRIAVLLGHAARLGAYRDDINLVWRRLRRERGRAGVNVQVADGAPDDGCLWVRAAGERHAPPRPWRPPAPGTPLLVLGDLGLLAPEPEARAGWLHLGRLIEAAGVSAIALCPVPAARAPAALARVYALHEWAPSARLAHPVRPGAGVDESSADIDALRAHLAPLLRVEPGLLRALRIGLGLHPVVEADLRRDPEIRNDGANLAWIGAAADLARERAFAALPLAEQRRVAVLIDAYHGGAPSLAMTERGLVEHYTRALPEVERLTVLDQAVRTELTAYRSRLVRLGHESTDGFFRNHWLPDNLARQGGAVLANSPQLQALWAASRRDDWREGKLELPDWLPRKVDLRYFLGAANLPPRPCLLVQSGDRLYLDRAPKTLVQGSVLAIATLQGDMVRIDVAGGPAPVSRALPVVNLPLDLGRLPADSATAFLDLGAERLWLASLSRPSWACAMTRDAGGLWAEVVWLGRRHRLARLPGENGAPAYWAGDGSVGIDAHSLHAGFTVNTPHGRAAQTLRWIEPGRFLMGSPEGEAPQFDDEGPQHEVTLTQGFWLADTACSQALWRAVMGKNPSRFKGDDLPVEQVSWNDVQGFLRKLEGLLPGVEARLPTEAEWEYACRAGTQTAYSFGDGIDREKANYAGNRGNTVAVKSFEPNAWGLYQMHGNVLEWCADGMRKYDDQPQPDPAEPGHKEAHRAVRGGSWISHARYARAASRDVYPPGGRYLYLGFRLALRSIKPSQVQPSGLEAAAREARAA